MNNLIYNELASLIIEKIPNGIIWEKIVLKIKRVEGFGIMTSAISIGTNNESEIISLRIGIVGHKLIDKIYDSIVQFAGEKSKWNRANFYLNKDLTYSIDFLWDKNLINTSDMYNEELL
jgi:hypothetical protein